MRQIYLIRHGKVAFLNGEKRCIGRTDLELGPEGIRQAEDLRDYFAGFQKLTVFTSPLKRARQTAQILAGGRFPVIAEEDLQELDMGEWENQPLRAIKKTLESQPEHGESRSQGLLRFRGALRRILDQSEGDVVCVAHAGINCCFLSWVLGTPLDTSREIRQPYGCISRIQAEDANHMSVLQLAQMPKSAPDPDFCYELFRRWNTPEEAVKHGEKVNQKALEIAGALTKAGCFLDLNQIQAAALLHDIAKGQKDHAGRGAWILEREGYETTADLIRRHHETEACAADKEPDEGDVVYLADKLVAGAEEVGLEERFSNKIRRFQQEQNEEALAQCLRRLEEARQVKRRVERRLGHCL